MLRASISSYKDKDTATTGVVDVASYREDAVYCYVGLLFKRRFWVLLELEMGRVMEWAAGLLKLENKRV
ncbi:hypothetical protein KY285_024191 [Solanum tuberosum]|nr:hypothetical protein KY289_024528 [Solanum tuberosum]KAH0673177.1 hypothetical protein KY284_024264 [Solanum tuberosum]KAH0676390.1 hypothetical protein KY285_024191 [Solanum tuberosum]